MLHLFGWNIIIKKLLYAINKKRIYLKKLDKSDDLVGDFSGVGGFDTNALNQSIAATSVKEQAKVLEYMRTSGKYSVPEIKKQNDLVTEMKKKRYAEILKEKAEEAQAAAEAASDPVGSAAAAETAAKSYTDTKLAWGTF